MCKVNPPTSQTYCFKCFTILQVSQKKIFRISQIERVDEVHKTLYYKRKSYKSVQSTLSYLITTSIPLAMFTHFLVEHGLSQYDLF